MTSNRRWTFREYIQFRQDRSSAEEAQRIQNMLAGAVHHLHDVQIGYGGVLNPDQLFVVEDDVPNSWNVAGEVIFVTTGLVQHFLNIRDEPYDFAELAELPALHINFQDLIPMAWVATHEYIHGIRRHCEAEREVGGDNLTQQATEFDADACATASIYRQLQKVLDVPDIDLRRVAYLYIHRALVGLPEPEVADSHPTHVHRLFFVFSKLVQVTADPMAPVDIDVKLPESRRRAEDLAPFWAACMKASGLVEQARRVKQAIPISTRWDQMRDTVADLSGTRTR